MRSLASLPWKYQFEILWILYASQNESRIHSAGLNKAKFYIKSNLEDINDITKLSDHYEELQCNQEPAGVHHHAARDGKQDKKVAEMIVKYRRNVDNSGDNTAILVEDIESKLKQNGMFQFK